MAGGAVNFDNNNTGGDFVTVDVTAEQDEGWFLALTVDVGDSMAVIDAILTDPVYVREFKNNVIEACDEFLAQHDK